MGNCVELVNASQTEALVITDCRGTQFTIGAAAWVLTDISLVHKWDLSLFEIHTRSVDVISNLGVKVCVEGTAQIRIKAYTDKSATQQDELALFRAHAFMYGKHTAAQQLAGDTLGVPDVVKEEIELIMEGHQRAVIGQLTVEELRSNPMKVKEVVAKIMTPDLVSCCVCDWVRRLIKGIQWLDFINTIAS